MFNSDKSSHSTPCAEIERSMGEYKVCTHECGESTKQVDEIVSKIMNLMRSEELTYYEAMRIPAHLKACLSLSFQEKILDSLVEPLSEQSNQ